MVDKDKYNVRLLNFTKQQMLDRSGLSYQQLREITAELADNKFLRYIEPDETYITTDKGLKFLEATKGTGKRNG